MYNEADEILYEDLIAAARFKPYGGFNPHAAEYFGLDTLQPGCHNGLQNGDRVELVNLRGEMHPIYTRIRVLGFSLNGLYCWCLVPGRKQGRVIMAISVRGKFTFDSQRYTLVKKE